MKQLVIVGGGFAGVWAAVTASRLRARRGAAGSLAITVISRDPWQTIRPRLYEDSLDDVRVRLDDVLEPAGIKRIEGTVRQIDHRARTVSVETSSGIHPVHYDRLVLAAGSRLQRPAIPGIELAMAVDSHAEAVALRDHLAALPPNAAISDRARYTAVVVGAGFTGIEVATSLVSRLRALAARDGIQDPVRVVVVERTPRVAPDLGDGARRHVERAFAQLGIETLTATQVTEVRADGVLLDDGRWIAAATTIWTGGLRASDLAGQLSLERDAVGRIAVDDELAVIGVEDVFAAGDVAHAIADGPPPRVAPMSCQCFIPMGEIAGYNAAAQLLGLPTRRYSDPHYVTCLDLGDAGALFMQGWEREVRLTGFWAKILKQEINTRLIYPPRPHHVSRPENAADAA